MGFKRIACCSTFGGNPYAPIYFIFTDVGDSSDDFTDTTLDDEAATSITSGSAPFTGTFQPEGSLSAFDGESADGVWTLQVNDNANFDGGTINSWSLEISSITGIDELSGLVREAAELVTLCRDKIQAAEVQVKTITEQLERDAPETPASEDTPTA